LKAKVETNMDITKQASRKAKTDDLLVRIEPMIDLEAVPNEIVASAPGVINVKPEECWVDREYQRNLSRKSRKLIYEMVSGWDWAKFKAPVLTRDEAGRYLIIDGQHTAIGAATHPDIKTIPAMFIPMTDVSDQARSFIGHNTARVPVASLDLWHARITAGDELATQANDVLNEFGISVVRAVQGSNQIWKTNQTVATAVVTKILSKHGLPKFRKVVEFVAACGFSPIKADHWRFAEALLLSAENNNSMFTPSMMLEVVRASNPTDALNEATKIARSIEEPVYRGLLVHYKNQYNKTYRNMR
jgi:hypothetical protein